MELGPALAKAMKAANMKDEHVSVASHISAFTIGHIRRGKIRNPRSITIQALRDNVPGLAELLDGVAA